MDQTGSKGRTVPRGHAGATDQRLQLCGGSLCVLFGRAPEAGWGWAVAGGAREPPEDERDRPRALCSRGHRQRVARCTAVLAAGRSRGGEGAAAIAPATACTDADGAPGTGLESRRRGHPRAPQGFRGTGGGGRVRRSADIATRQLLQQDHVRRSVALSLPALNSRLWTDRSRRDAGSVPQPTPKHPPELAHQLPPMSSLAPSPRRAGRCVTTGAGQWARST